MIYPEGQLCFSEGMIGWKVSEWENHCSVLRCERILLWYSVGCLWKLGLGLFKIGIHFIKRGLITLQAIILGQIECMNDRIRFGQGL